MKKLVVIAVLMAALAGVIYPQELKFDGYLNSGLGVVTDSTERDAFAKAFGVDSESNGYRFRLNGSYTNEAKNAGVRLRIQSQRRTDRGGLFSLPYAYGWVGFFENKFTVTGGLIMDGTWETSDWYWQDDQGEGLGLLLKAEPVKGLNLGFGAYTLSQQSGGSNNQLATWNGSAAYNGLNFADLKPALWRVKYTFNAAYTLPDTFRLSTSFRLKNKAGYFYPSSYTYDDVYAGREESSQIIGEFRLLKVKDLTTVVVGVIDRLEDFNDNGYVLLTETFAYKINDDLTLGFNAAQFLYSSDQDKDLALLFNLWGSYAFGKVVPRIDLTYFWGGQSKTGTSDDQWERKGFTAKNGMPGSYVTAANRSAKGVDDDYSVFSARPSVKINLDSRTFLEIGDMINYDFANFNGYVKSTGATSATGDTKSKLTNVFYVDVKFSF